MKSTAALKWILLAVALILWVSALWFAWMIHQEGDARVQDLASNQEGMQLAQSNLRTHVIAQQTGNSRAQLSQLFQIDPVTAANEITQAGTSAGVDAHVSGAASGQASLGNAVTFTVEADGSFPALLKTESLLETLPFPSQVEQIDLSKTPDNGTPGSTSTWHLNVSLEVLIASSTSL